MPQGPLSCLGLQLGRSPLGKAGPACPASLPQHLPRWAGPGPPHPSPGRPLGSFAHHQSLKGYRLRPTGARLLTNCPVPPQGLHWKLWGTQLTQLSPGPKQRVGGADVTSLLFAGNHLSGVWSLNHAKLPFLWVKCVQMLAALHGCVCLVSSLLL